MGIFGDRNKPAKYGKQPVKALYIAYQVASTLLVRLPFWYLISILPQLRPRKKWTIERCVRTRFMLHAFEVNTRVNGYAQVPNYLAIGPGQDIDAEWIEPDPSLVLGKLESFAAAANVSPARIPGYWLRQPSCGRKVELGERVLLSLHGGLYVLASAHPADPLSVVTRGIMAHTPSVRHVFAAEYRLSSPTAHPFPAALLDALAAYAHLVRAHGVTPADIIVEGDSAGGNLALALTRYLVEHKDELASLGLAPPGALILVSPWCDMGVSHELPQSPGYFEQSDLLIVDGEKAHHRYPVAAFVGPHGLAAADTNPYISPASRLLKDAPSFADWPRTFLVCGGAESFAPSIRTLRDRMAVGLISADGVARLEYYEAPDAIHDYVAFPWHEPERTDTLKALAAWIASE